MIFFFVFFFGERVSTLTEDCGMDLLSIWVPKLAESWRIVDGKMCRHDPRMTYFVLEPHEECVHVITMAHMTLATYPSADLLRRVRSLSTFRGAGMYFDYDITGPRRHMTMVGRNTMLHPFASQPAED